MFRIRAYLSFQNTLKYSINTFIQIFNQYNITTSSNSVLFLLCRIKKICYLCKEITYGNKPTELNVELAIFEISIRQSACRPRYIPCGIAVGAWTVIDREAMRGPTFKNGTCVLFL